MMSFCCLPHSFSFFTFSLMFLPFYPFFQLPRWFHGAASILTLFSPISLFIWIMPSKPQTLSLPWGWCFTELLSSSGRSAQALYFSILHQPGSHPKARKFSAESQRTFTSTTGTSSILTHPAHVHHLWLKPYPCCSHPGWFQEVLSLIWRLSCASTRSGFHLGSQWGMKSDSALEQWNFLQPHCLKHQLQAVLLVQEWCTVFWGIYFVCI